MKIALDAMGGDHAPRETVQGALLAVRDAELLQMAPDLQVVLVGRKEDIEKELAGVSDAIRKSLPVLDAREVVEMGESPAQACKQKRDSSIVRCAGLVKNHEVDATVSAGNSGAAMAAALMMCGRIDGVLRPAIVTMVPTINGYSVLVDAGANVDSKAKHLLQFALMGEVFARIVLNFKSPRVGLLSIGEEESKGNELVFETQALLKKVPLNYIGNVEGRDTVNGQCDVTVCDGFVGNVALKAIEGVGELVMTGLAREIKSNLITLIGGLIARPAFKRFKKHVDWREFGGAPLLGIDGLNLISHGKSDAFAIKNAIRMALRCVSRDMNGVLKEQINKYGQVSDKPDTPKPTGA